MKHWALAAVATAGCLLAGCMNRQSEAPATRPVTAVDAEQAKAAYWYEQPGEQSVSDASYEALWQASVRAAKDRFFTIEITDYRRGLLATAPSVSEQFFEPWRNDVADGHALTQASLGTIRRTIRFEFEATGERHYKVTPKVLVERESLPERRTTVAARYRTVFVPEVDNGAQMSADIGNPGEPAPKKYWYAIGRDYELESVLAKDISKLLQ
jgi:outer membrane murein-binding lipoprotein Lpp